LTHLASHRPVGFRDIGVMELLAVFIASLLRESKAAGTLPRLLIPVVVSPEELSRIVVKQPTGHVAAVARTPSEAAQNPRDQPTHSPLHKRRPACVCRLTRQHPRLSPIVHRRVDARQEPIFQLARQEDGRH
jgi:hypothetical protein